jgi:hypothetical protein
MSLRMRIDGMNRLLRGTVAVNAAKWGLAMGHIGIDIRKISSRLYYVDENGEITESRYYG